MNKKDKQFILDELAKTAYQVGREVGDGTFGAFIYNRAYGRYTAYYKMAVYANIEGIYENVEYHPEYERGWEK